MRGGKYPPAKEAEELCDFLPLPNKRRGILADVQKADDTLSKDL